MGIRATNQEKKKSPSTILVKESVTVQTNSNTMYLSDVQVIQWEKTLAKCC